METIAPWAGAPWAPRKWQAEALPLILDAARARKRGLVSAIMGSGKSVLQAELAALAMPRASGRALVLSAPRQQLVRQLSGTVEERLGSMWSVGRFYSDEKDVSSDVIVCCNASLPALAGALNGRKVALLILDEAHGSEAERVRETARALAPAVLVGFTATPFRSVPRESLSLYDTVVYRYTLEQAITDGCLVPPRVVRWWGDPGTDIDTACLEMIRRDGGGPGIVSAITIEDAELYAARLRGGGIEAEAIHSGHHVRERQDKLTRLQAGGVRCLVHVSLLAEGVDFPWLRWICLRRHVQARVRFIQELGRVLRSHPGKTEGVVLDPHLLLGKHGLETVEAIGAALLAAAEAEEKDPGVGERTRKEREAIAIESLTEYLGRMREAMETAGICAPRWSDGKGDGWRLASPSEKQAETIRKVKRLTCHIPAPWGDPIRILAGVPFALTRGEASDLMDILMSGAAFAKRNLPDWCSDRPYLAQWDSSLIRIPLPDEEAVKVGWTLKP